VQSPPALMLGCSDNGPLQQHQPPVSNRARPPKSAGWDRATGNVRKPHIAESVTALWPASQRLFPACRSGRQTRCGTPPPAMGLLHRQARVVTPCRAYGAATHVL